VLQEHASTRTWSPISVTQPPELLAAPAATIVAPLAHLGVIEVGGAEAASFLHQQLTSDVKHLADGEAQHSAWCSAKGRMLASFLVFRSGSNYQLQLSADLLPAILKRLQMFVLRSKVSIVDHSDVRQIIGLSGPRAEEALHAAGLAVPGAALSCVASADGLVIRLDSQRFELLAQQRGRSRALASACCRWRDRSVPGSGNGWMSTPAYP
jgi:folate-binding Fe-S cluster repair protein YgfZ